MVTWVGMRTADTAYIAGKTVSDPDTVLLL